MGLRARMGFNYIWQRPEHVPAPCRNPGTIPPARAFRPLLSTQEGVVTMAAPQQKPRIVPEREPEYREEDPAYRQTIADPAPPNVYVDQTARRSGSSTGLIIAALLVVLGILFALSFDWTGTSTTPAVTDNSAPATSDPLTPVPATPPAAEAPAPPAAEAPATPPATTTQ
jgi:hypothetical protein